MIGIYDNSEQSHAMSYVSVRPEVCEKFLSLKNLHKTKIT